MSELFDSDSFLTQRARLIAERDRINAAIHKLDEFLVSIGIIPDASHDGKITTTEAVRRICIKKKTQITKSYVTKAILERYPSLAPSDATVAAILVSFAKETPPFLHVEVKGSGRRGAEYGIEKPPRLALSDGEVKILMNEERLTGTGGWQSLYKKLQDNYDSEEGNLIFPDSLKEQIRHYCKNYGGGGFQTDLKKALGRHVPEIFQ